MNLQEILVALYKQDVMNEFATAIATEMTYRLEDMNGDVADSLVQILDSNEGAAALFELITNTENVTGFIREIAEDVINEYGDDG